MGNASGSLSNSINTWALNESTTALAAAKNIANDQYCKRTGPLEIFCIDVLGAP